jgi:hypothetical protein
MYKRIRGALRRFVCQITTPADAEFNVDATWLHEDGVDMPSPEEFGRRMALTYGHDEFMRRTGRIWQEADGPDDAARMLREEWKELLERERDLERQNRRESRPGASCIACGPFSPETDRCLICGSHPAPAEVRPMCKPSNLDALNAALTVAREAHAMLSAAHNILDLAGLAAEADDAMGALSATIGLVQHVEGSRKSLQRNG